MKRILNGSNRLAASLVEEMVAPSFPCFTRHPLPFIHFSYVMPSFAIEKKYNSKKKAFKRIKKIINTLKQQKNCQTLNIFKWLRL